jgi:hypothetical protein
VPSSLAWDGRVSGRGEWILIRFLAAGLWICLDPSRSKAPEARSDSGKTSLGGNFGVRTSHTAEIVEVRGYSG